MKPQGPPDKRNWIFLVLPTRFIVGCIFLITLYCTVSVGNWMAQWSNHSSDFEKKKGIYSIFENSGVTFRGGIKYLNQVNYSAQSPRIILASEQNWIDKDTKSIISNFKNVVAPSEGAHSISQMDVPHTHWLLNAPATWKSHSHSILKESVHSRSNKQLKSNISMLFDGRWRQNRPPTQTWPKHQIALRGRWITQLSHLVSISGSNPKRDKKKQSLEMTGMLGITIITSFNSPFHQHEFAKDMQH